MLPYYYHDDAYTRYLEGQKQIDKMLKETEKEKEKKSPMKTFGKIVCVIILLALIFALFDFITPNGMGFLSRVKNGHVAVVTEFGKSKDEVLEAGFHFKKFTEILNPMSIQTQKTSAKLSAFSSDIQQVETIVTLNYNIDKKNAVTLFREVGKNYETSLMMPRIQENTKIIFAQYTAENLVQNRDALSIAILELMREDLTPYGINVSAIAIEDIDFTDAFTNAVEAKQVASQEKLTAQTQQERLTMEAKAEAERAVIEAEAKAERDKIEADAEAYAIKTKADAEAEANTKIAKSLIPELIDYIFAQNWDGELPTVSGGDFSNILDFRNLEEGF